jgi:hypothetical protein
MLFPEFPLPSSISAPAIIDPMLRFQADSGYEVRRALASRPRRRYTVEYLGQTTHLMRYIRDFLMDHRNGVLPFQWRHSTGLNSVPCTNTTPVWLQFMHGLVTGQWIDISGGAAPSLLGQWQVTRIDSINISLNGSVAAGATTVLVSHYLPFAVARFNENTWESPTKLIGPEQLDIDGRRMGYFSYTLQIEEIF